MYEALAHVLMLSTAYGENSACGQSSHISPGPRPDRFPFKDNPVVRSSAAVFLAAAQTGRTSV